MRLRHISLSAFVIGATFSPDSIFAAIFASFDIDAPPFDYAIYFSYVFATLFSAFA